MSVIQTLFHHLIDPMIMIMAVLAGLITLGFKMRLIVAFTIGLIVELYFVMNNPGQDVALFTLLLGGVAAYMWMTVSRRLKEMLLRMRG